MHHLGASGKARAAVEATTWLPAGQGRQPRAWSRRLGIRGLPLRARPASRQKQPDLLQPQRHAARNGYRGVNPADSSHASDCMCRASEVTASALFLQPFFFVRWRHTEAVLPTFFKRWRRPRLCRAPPQEGARPHCFPFLSRACFVVVLLLLLLRAPHSSTALLFFFFLSRSMPRASLILFISYKL